MNNLKKAILFALLGVFTLVLIPIYLLLALRYKDGYSVGTYINGYYVTGKTPRQVDELLSSLEQVRNIEIETAAGEFELLSLGKEECSYDYHDSLDELKREQNPFAWPLNIFIGKTYKVNPSISYDMASIERRIDSLAIFENEEVMPKVSLYLDESLGYCLQDNTKDLFNHSIAKNLIVEGILEGDSTISLLPAYQDAPWLDSYQTLYEDYERLKEFQDFHMCYLLGDDREEITPTIVSGWAKTGEKGDYLLEGNSLVLDEEKLYAYVDYLADKYDTYDVVRQYVTHDGKRVEVPLSLYGNLIDRQAEKDYLLNAYLTRSEEDHEPAYLHKETYQGLHDLGPDYIEVNKTTQHLYLIKNNEVVMESDVVTGNARFHGTPSVCTTIQGMYRNRTLRGPGYEAFVRYWVPVYKAIGIHDASWRSNFGGSIYQGNGSHGCINVPSEVMEKLYEEMYTGMPVIIFSEEGS